MDDKAILARAREAIDSGNFKAAHSLLQPLVKNGNPEALFLSSTFSFPSTESDAQFEERSLNFLIRASNAGYPPALYALGVCYDLGDLVEPNAEKAGVFFKQAAEAGYSKAKFSHGRNLFYGSNGLVQEVQQALHFIKEAANEGVEDAAEFLRHL
jgi:TPR repeat protein